MLFRSHSRGLLAYACAIVSAFSSAEDVLHQVFERLLRGDIKIDDYVRMRDVIVTPYKGQIGRVVGIKRNSRNRETLDKYAVRFSDGNTVEVWSIQLEAVRTLELKTTA